MPPESKPGLLDELGGCLTSSRGSWWLVVRMNRVCRLLGEMLVLPQLALEYVTCT
jgi:hypothetical protein